MQHKRSWIIVSRALWIVTLSINFPGHVTQINLYIYCTEYMLCSEWMTTTAFGNEILTYLILYQIHWLNLFAASRVENTCNEQKHMNTHNRLRCCNSAKYNPVNMIMTFLKVHTHRLIRIKNIRFFICRTFDQQNDSTKLSNANLTQSVFYLGRSRFLFHYNNIQMQKQQNDNNVSIEIIPFFVVAVVLYGFSSYYFIRHRDFVKLLFCFVLFWLW